MNVPIPKRSFLPLMVLLAIGGLKTVAAADTPVLNPVANDPFWIMQGGLELDEEGGYAANGRVSYLHSEQTAAVLNFGVSDTSADLSNFATRYASVLLDHSFGPVGGSVSVGWSDSADIVKRFRYGGSIYFQGAGIRLEITGDDWSSDFEPFEFSRLIDREPPLPPLLLTGSGNCSLDSTALGGNLRYSRGAWSIYGGATSYDYSNADCDFSATLGDIDLTNPPDVLADFAPTFFRRLAVATASQIINSDTVFLDSSASVGLSVSVADKNLALDFYHSEEIFQGLTADTLIASVFFPGGSQTDWEMRVGATDFENAGVIVFIGATLYWYIGGGP